MILGFVILGSAIISKAKTILELRGKVLKACTCVPQLGSLSLHSPFKIPEPFQEVASFTFHH